MIQEQDAEQLDNDYEDFLLKLYEVSHHLAHLSLTQGVGYLEKDKEELANCRSLHLGAGTGSDMFAACTRGFGVVHGVEILPLNVSLVEAYCQDPENTIERIANNRLAGLIYNKETTARYEKWAREQLRSYQYHQKQGKEFLVQRGSAEEFLRQTTPQLYDLIVCNLSMHHFCEAPWMLDQVLESIARLLNRGGVLVCGVLGAMVYETEQQWRADRLEEGENSPTFEHYMSQLADTMWNHDLPIIFELPSNRITHRHYPLSVFQTGCASLQFLDARREMVVTSCPLEDYLKGNPPRFAAWHLGVGYERILSLVPEVIREMGEEAKEHLQAPWNSYVWTISFCKR